MSIVFYVLTGLIVVTAVLLALLVLVQNSKGGGLAAGFSSGNQVMGAPKTADFLEKATWSLMGLIVALSIFAVGLNQDPTKQDSDGAPVQTELNVGDDIPSGEDAELPLTKE
jgi:preprotein translocase subunit SecG